MMHSFRVEFFVCSVQVIPDAATKKNIEELSWRRDPSQPESKSVRLERIFRFIGITSCRCPTQIRSTGFPVDQENGKQKRDQTISQEEAWSEDGDGDSPTQEHKLEGIEGVGELRGRVRISLDGAWRLHRPFTRWTRRRLSCWALGIRSILERLQIIHPGGTWATDILVD